MVPVEWRSIPTPLGPLVAVECAEGMLLLEFPGRAGAATWQARLRRHRPDAEVVVGPCTRSVEWLEGYFAGADLATPYPGHLDRWLPVTPAQALVWRALCAIPPGETRSYDDIARATGLHPRLVGQLNGANHLAIRIPCHRVVGKRGDLVGYGGGLDRKRWLLDHELRVAGFGPLAPPVPY